jgi:hypothetical protein
VAKARKTHVIPAKSGWALRNGGMTKSAVYKTQTEAVNAAKLELRGGGGEVFIHGRDGRIRQADSVGKSHVGRVVKDPPKRGKLAKSRVKDAVWNGSKALDVR